MAKDFSDFDIEDFAFDESFQKWVLQPDSESGKFWDDYLLSHPHQTDKLLAARALVLDLHQPRQRVQDPELAESIWQNVQLRISPQRPALHFVVRYWQIAAMITLFLGIGTTYFLTYEGSQRVLLPVVKTDAADQDWIEEVNRTNQETRIHLSDGSTVSLGKDSRLRYPREFGPSQREVHLVGEAFFDVMKNPNQPFLVFADETVTKVLGTSFRIKAYANAPKVSVEVRTGRVSVFMKKDFEGSTSHVERKGLVLTPNQQAVFSRDLAHLDKTLVEIPVLLAPPAQKISFEFNNTPVDKIFTILQQAYGLEIIYEPELVADRSLTVSLEDESLFEKLDVICRTLGLTYQSIDAQIIIENKSHTN
jgi:transmembrane sensor